jgi:excisionase family DNA binding protein
MEKALTLKEAAALLGVSYSTVYTHTRDLGFFQIGNQWRVWPDTLRQNLEKHGEEQASEPVGSARRSQSESRTQSRHLASSTGLVGQAAVDRKLDELLARKSQRKLDARLARKSPKRRS